MTSTGQSRIWEDAASPLNDGLARRFVSDWRRSQANPPDPAAYLPDDPVRRPGALLALLRADLSMRRAAGELVRVEWYLRRFPELPPEVLVALAYEEYCVREESGEVPDRQEYHARFPDIASEVRQLIDIHEFVDSSRGLLDGHESIAPAPNWPRAGEMITGFRLIDELGKGAIARVFLAAECRLGDRQVALKISSAGSREPQTLALLQHTHIVPVYSYHVDAATGLHLLCMPYFGRVTLADILNSARCRTVRTGSDLIAVLDELGKPEDIGVMSSRRSEAREALRSRSWARAIAWWGARLAEALQYAHDRGVLHRDIKPSNVLITADAMPMLLDFNLARPSPADGCPPTAIGGTLAYMAPEHLAAATETSDRAAREDARLDGRADIYSLGVVLYEALAARPFGPAIRDSRAGPALGALIESRRAQVPRLKASSGRKIPAALGAVIERCLQPDRADRYTRAADLAADLQAVAENAPLVFAREPQPDRALKWAYRNRRTLVLGIGAGVLAVVFFAFQSAAVQREAVVRRELDTGTRSAAAGDFDAAAAHFAMAADRARAGGSRALRTLAAEAEHKRQDALAASRVRDKADSFFRQVEPIRYKLVTRHGLQAASEDLLAVLSKFEVLGSARWTENPELDRLDPDRRARLLEEVNEVLFLWVVASDLPGDAEASRRAGAMCKRALSFAEPKGPWLALKARYEGVRGGGGATLASAADEPVARAAFELGLVAVLEGRLDRALACFERAVRLRPDRFWYQFALAYHHAAAGDASQAMAHYDAAVALRPDASWALFNRAQLAWSRQGAWEAALLDLSQLEKNPDGLDPSLLALEAGRITQRLGDFPSALHHYDTVIATDKGGDLARRARLNRARIDEELGPGGRARAWSFYDSLLRANPADSEARLHHALHALRSGRPNVAEDDLTYLLGKAGTEASNASRRAALLSARALSRVAQIRPADAMRDADSAVRVDPSPGRARVHLRVALAAGRDDELAIVDPDEIDRLPVAGKQLAADLRAAAERLRVAVDRPKSTPDDPPAIVAQTTRAAILSALGDHAAAVGEADVLVQLSPRAADPRLLRARIRRRAGDFDGAAVDARAAIALSPGDPRAKGLLGRLMVDSRRPLDALDTLDAALGSGAGREARLARGLALWELGRASESAADWTLALRDDPEDAAAFLGRARSFIALGRLEQALADLESAADWSGNRPAVLSQIALVYSSCLPARPNRLSRVMGLACRAAIEHFRE
jgi:serine/threonine protein kinase/Tfp pilus assembly protein PilF